MHEQIRTSPAGATLMARLAAVRGISIEGVGPELDPDARGASPMNHMRFAFLPKDFGAAMAALEKAGFEPERRHAIVLELTHKAGSLDQALAKLAAYEIESVLVLAGQSRSGRTLVSVGLDREVPDADWATLGGCTNPGIAPPHP
jgi:hypothetical protein